MAWPFSGVGPPNGDTGPDDPFPTSLTSLTTALAWVVGMHVRNGDSVQRTVTLTNTAGKKLVGPFKLQPGAEQPFEWPFRPTTGIQRVADGPNVTGQIWWYE